MILYLWSQRQRTNVTSFFIIAISCLMFSSAVRCFPTNTLPNFLLLRHFIAYGLLFSSVLNTNLTFPKLPLPSSLTTIYWFIFFFPSLYRDVDTCDRLTTDKHWDETGWGSYLKFIIDCGCDDSFYSTLCIPSLSGLELTPDALLTSLSLSLLINILLWSRWNY